MFGGSSPRMRGAPFLHARWHRLAGIIPAYAGSTSFRPRTHRSRWDHPRVCGEHHCPRYEVSRFPGSSPRMRGALRIDGPVVNPQGIIPAYAGSTARSHAFPSRDWDHPRVCGEHQTTDKASVNNMGSSPRMRGAHRHALRYRHSHGIIPAYAGSTAIPLPDGSECRDHPRVCGEHSTSSFLLEV